MEGHVTHEARSLTAEDEAKLARQDSSLVSEFKRNKLEADAKKNWDLFYKRNETRFFKDRHWTLREFSQLVDAGQNGKGFILLEVGCGVGNFVFPLIEEEIGMFIYACDFSPRAVDLVKNDARYDETRIKAFTCDVTQDRLSSTIPEVNVDVTSMVFVLSAIHPEKFHAALENINSVMKPGGVLIFRDYGLYDMAQIRFGPGNKLGENFYVRQDGTRSYFFTVEELSNLVTRAGFEVAECHYVHRRTINKKENVDEPRVFVQGKFTKKPVAP